MKTILTSILCLLLLAGCLTLEQSMRFKDDGSLVVSYSCSYPAEQEEAIQAAIEELLARKGGPRASFLDKAAAESFYAERGAELTFHRKHLHDGTARIQMMVVARQATRAIALGAFGEMRLTPVDNRVLLEIPLPAISKELKAHAQAVCKGFETTLVVETPGKLVRHNGTALADNKLSWTLKLDEIPPRDLFAEWAE